MSDRVTRAIAAFAGRVTYEDLSEDVISETKRRIIDTLGCLVSGYDQDATIAARKLASQYETDRGATIIGTNRKVNADIATLANGTAIRYLDFNDTYLSVEPQHPSDTIAPLLALAEARKLPAKDLITAITVAYETSVIFCDAASLKNNGWDHVNYITLATVAGGANLLKLSQEETEQAIALAIVPHAAMRQTRNGEISMWKGAAASNAARNAVFALQLAEAGMEGPYEPIEGTMGVNYQLLNQKLDAEDVIRQFEKADRPIRILQTYVKNWAVEYMTQSAIEAALALNEEIDSFEDIEQIHVETFQMAYDILAKDEQKWAPKTRATADHSLPYITVVALEDGKIDLDTFDKERLSNETTRNRLKTMITIEVTDEMNAGYPDGNPNRITLTLKTGEKLEKLVKHPAGHSGNPMTDEQIVDKYKRLTGGALTAEQQNNSLETLWEFENMKDYDALYKHFILKEAVKAE
ncbi:MmgE/PrpD family protein [Oceanobacillus saliphilus]|uniref:MmgE/PrpD family protein n=1 Tax=Oceanobacillus saliphilus TaxID=2925834 RepID=UPI00201DF6E9|nr:MmgE/PrpD family protein [Oceanobacillus saliphilus]